MADWKKTEQLYEGKAKKVFATENPEVVIVGSCNIVVLLVCDSISCLISTFSIVNKA